MMVELTAETPSALNNVVPFCSRATIPSPLVFTILPKINRTGSRARPPVAAHFRRTFGPFLVAVFILLSSHSAIATEPEPRDTVLFNAGWRFQSGDPDGPRDSLDYAHLRSWLLPSGDACLSPDAGHHRPDGNPGEGRTLQPKCV